MNNLTGSSPNGGRSTSATMKEPETKTNESSLQLQLSENERELFRMLLDAAEWKGYRVVENHLDVVETTTATATATATTATETAKNPVDTRRILSIRVAGGWVRDKILGLESDDVDIALGGGLYGREFAETVAEYLKHHHVDDEGGMEAGTLAVISANPAQSKHLETAVLNLRRPGDKTTSFCPIDFVHLRGDEVYAENDGNRIPTVQHGTPREDAMRRDFTINALFYNLASGKVEDFTERGLDDLSRGRIVTPIDPAITFQDDPLRVLRAVRFAVRYQFALDDVIVEAARSTHVHHYLEHKVSRERVGKELEGMLSGTRARPTAGLRTLADLHLAESVLGTPSPPWSSSSLNASDLFHRCVHGVDVVDELQELLDQLPKKHDPRLLSLGAFLLPFFNHTVMVGKPGKKKEMPAVPWMLKECVKFKNTDVSTMALLVDVLEEARRLWRKCKTTPPSPSSSGPLGRLEMGLFLRRTKDLWSTALVLAAVAEQVELTTTTMTTDRRNAAVTDDFCLTNTATCFGQVLSMDGCWKARPVLDGKTLTRALQLPRGPLVGTYLDLQYRFCMEHPHATAQDVEDHLQRLRQQRRADGVDGD